MMRDTTFLSETIFRPLQLLHTGRPEAWHPDTSDALSYPILSGTSRLREAASHLAARRYGRQPRRAGRTASAAREQRLPATGTWMLQGCLQGALRKGQRYNAL